MIKKKFTKCRIKSDQQQDKKLHRNFGSQMPLRLKQREGIVIQTRAEQTEIVIIQAVDKLGVTWLVIHTTKWLICI